MQVANNVQSSEWNNNESLEDYDQNLDDIATNVLNNSTMIHSPKSRPLNLEGACHWLRRSGIMLMILDLQFHVSCKREIVELREYNKFSR